MWHELLGLLVVYIALVTGAVAMILRDGRDYDAHVAEALDMINEDVQ